MQKFAYKQEKFVYIEKNVVPSARPFPTGGFPPNLRSHRCANNNLLPPKYHFYASINDFFSQNLAYSKNL